MAMPSHFYTAAITMHEEHKLLGSLFMRLPFELRIDIYERIVNASLDNSLLPNPLDPMPMQKAMLRTLHINRAVCNESHGICTKLAKRHIQALETSIEAENISRVEIINISLSLPPAANSPRFQPYWLRYKRLAGLAEQISYDANKLVALHGLLRVLHVPHRSRLHLPWLDVLRRLHLLLRDSRSQTEP